MLRTLVLVVTMCTFVAPVLVAQGTFTSSDMNVSNESSSESATLTILGKPLQIPFSASKVRILVKPEYDTVYIKEVSQLGYVRQGDTIIAMIPSDYIPELTTRTIEYESIVPVDSPSTNSINMSDADSLPDLLLASPEGCVTTNRQAGNSGRFTGDYAIPGDAGGNGVTLSPGSFSGATAEYSVSLTGYSSCVNSLTSLTLYIWGQEVCFLGGCLNPVVAVYNWCTGQWDYNWSFPNKNNAYHSITISNPSCYLSSGSKSVSWGVSVAPANKTYVWETYLSACFTDLNGTIHATSTPTGASVYVDGTYRGTTPLDYSATPGSHSVRMSYSCYADCSQTAQVTCGQIANVNCTLTRQYGSVGFTSSPSGASVYEGSTFLGITPFTKNDAIPGAHTYTYRLSCYQENSCQQTVTCNTLYSCSATLTPLNATVSFTSNPTGATVYEGSSNLGTTPFTISTVSPGSHTYSLRKDCYSNCSRTITACGGSQNVSCDLSPLSTTARFTSTPTGATVYENGSPIGTTPFTANVTPGPHTYTARLAGYQDAPPQNPNFTCGSTNTPVNFVLQPCLASICGIVTAPNGTTPIPGVTVTATCNGSPLSSVQTDATGSYCFSNLPTGCSPIVVTPTRSSDQFSPPNRTCPVSCQSTSFTQQNFSDNTTKTISGRVTYTACDHRPVPGVPIFVNDQQGGVTNPNGEFTVSCNIGSVTLRPQLSGHVFIPPTRTGVILDNTSGWDFSDDTKYQVVVTVKTGCNVLAGVNVSVVGTNCQASGITSSAGQYAVDVPPGSYTVSATLAGYAFEPQSIVITDRNVSVDLVSKTYLRVSTETPDPGDCPSVPHIGKGEKYTYRLQVFDGYNCQVNGASLIIMDEVSDTGDVASLPDTIVLASDRNYYDYEIVGGKPKGSKTLRFSVYKAGYDNVNNVSLLRSITVTGRRWLTNTFTVSLPKSTPLLMLYDPPGDRSFSEWQQGQTLSLGFGLSLEQTNEAKLKLSAGTTDIVPVKLKGSVEVGVTAKIAGKFDYVLDMSSTTTMRTSADPSPEVLGPGGGTWYLTAGIKLKYGAAREIFVNECVVDSEKVLSFELDSNQTNVVPVFVSEYFIRNSIIPPLPDTGKTAWQKLLSLNPTSDCVLDQSERERLNTRFLSSTLDSSELIWSGGGGSKSYSSSITTGKRLTIEASLTLSAEIVGEFGLKGVFVEGSAEATVKSEISIGGYISGGTLNSTTIGYQLEDANSTDAFHTIIYQDASFRTPVFFNGAGTTTSCPWEHCTDKIENISIINKSRVRDTAVCMGTPACIQYGLDFSGLPDGSSFRVYAPTESNTCGASVTFNNSPGPIDVYVNNRDTFIVNTCITPINCACGPNRVVIKVESACDPQIFSVDTVVVRCASGCDGIRITSPMPPVPGTPVVVCGVVRVSGATQSSDYSSVRFYHRRGAAGGLFLDTTITQRTGTIAPYSYTANWDSRLWQPGDYWLYLVPVIGSEERWTGGMPDSVLVRVDNVAPSIVRNYPPNDSCAVDRVLVTFSEPIDNSTLTCQSFTVMDLTSNTQVACQAVTLTDNTAEFFPLAPLRPDHQYQGRVTTAVKDLSCNTMELEYSWTFGCSTCPFSVYKVTNASGLLHGCVTIDNRLPNRADCIGAFDIRGRCVGTGTLVESGGVAYIYGLQVYGDDLTTSPDIEGVRSGETFTLKLYDVDSKATLTLPQAFDCWVNTNGSPLPGPCGIPTTCYNFGGCVDVINLKAGWNLISFDVDVEPCAPQSVFASLGSNLIYVTGFEGGSLLFDPNGLPFLNTLTCIKPGYAYWVKVTTDANLTVQGECIPNTFTRSLAADWNLLGYWPKMNMAPQTAFQPAIASNNMIYVTGFNGGSTFFDPNGLPFLNTLTIVENGFGYWVKLSSPIPDFTYPLLAIDNEDNQLVRDDLKLAASSHNYFRCEPTYLSATLIRRVKIDGSFAPDGADVAAFDASGNCVGTAKTFVHGDDCFVVMPIYGDDPATLNVKEGLRESEPFYLKLFVAENATVLSCEERIGGWLNTNGAPLEQQSNSTATVHFASGSATLVEIPRDFQLSQNYPNPFNPITSINFSSPRQIPVTLTVYDLTGRVVRVLFDGVCRVGVNTFTWDATSIDGHTVASGLYLYKLSAGNWSETKKMLLLK